MGERKVIQKWYPPDFDPSKLPKTVKAKNNEMKVRMMLPMSVRCTSCGEFLGRGKKYNARKETVAGEDYLGIKVFRFYMRCNRCSAEFTIKTDPKNSDYVAEMGATRNFEPWKPTPEEQAAAAAAAAAAQAQAPDAMAALEQRTADSRRELEIHDALQELRVLRAAQNQVAPEQLQSALPPDPKAVAQAEDDALVAQIVFHSGAGYVRRIEDEDEDEEEEEDDGKEGPETAKHEQQPAKRLRTAAEELPKPVPKAPAKPSAPAAPSVRVVAKPKQQNPPVPVTGASSSSSAAPTTSQPQPQPQPQPETGDAFNRLGIDYPDSD